ncbi:dihydrofolate reductase family protein [Seohaeicola nanhaiensis]|uniref:Dihydrofolate reductase family protein n=1 Tax=Seohaeicola nanhaiensis TaxID=1387282 RepID=A0ABV9KH29_9RHOB
MAKFIYGMNLSLDGYVDHDRFAPDPVLFRHWIDQVANGTASIYGRHIYELMRYWDDDQPGWTEDEHAFADAWRKQHKWVVSRTLTSAGPNATLVAENIDSTIRQLKSDLKGEIDISGTLLAHSLSTSGLIDEYRLYYHPVVLGSGKPFFAGPRPPLRLTGSERIGDSVIRLTYVPA